MQNIIAILNGIFIGSGSGGGGAAPVFSFGNALKFDGVNDFVGPNTNLSNENDVSLSCWINAETTSHGYNVLLANSSGTQYFAIRIIGSESKLIKFEGFGIFNSLNTNNTFIENTWFHIGVIQSGNSVSYYYNGVLQGTGVGNSSKRSDIDLIGKYGGAAGGGLKLKGLLDEYVLWNTALTDSQMKNQYNLGAGNFADADVTPLVYYSCNQADGTTPLGNDGNGGSSYDGTLNYFATPYFVPHTPAFSFGNALEFDGANDYVNTATNTFADLLYDVNGQYTLSFWVKPNSLVGAPVLFSGSTSTGKFFFELGATAGTLYWGAASGGYRTYTTVGFSVGNWNHFMITKTAVGNNANLYCNGSLESSYTGSLVDVGNVNNQLYFGQYHTGGAKLNGVLDEIAIWNGTTGTAQNALDLYNGGSGALASDVIASPTAYWRMNGSGTDTTAVDETGNYNGTLNYFVTPYFVPHTLDTDAAAFISAAAITGATQKLALNQLVLDLKGTGSTTNNSDVFSDLYALYPTCPIDGSTQTLTGYSFNIVDPLSYQITWVNAPTFDSTGVIFTGTQYGNTNFDIATDPDSFTSFGVGVDVLSFSSGNGAFMGAYDGGSQAVQLLQISSTFGGNIFDVYTVKATLTGGSNLKSVIRRTLSDMESYENGISVNTNTTTISTPSPSSAVITIAARSSVLPKTCKLGVSFISKGLSDNQSKDLFDSITTYNTALGR